MAGNEQDQGEACGGVPPTKLQRTRDVRRGCCKVAVHPGQRSTPYRKQFGDFQSSGNHVQPELKTPAGEQKAKLLNERRRCLVVEIFR